MKKCIFILLIFFIFQTGCTNTNTLINRNLKGKVFYAYSTWQRPPYYQGNPFTDDGVGLQVYSVAYEGLFDYISLNGTYYPRLAKSYENKGNQTVIHLQPGVKWSDGKKFTSRDVWAYYMLNYNAPITKYLSDIKIPDDNTVIFIWADPQLNTNLKMQYLASDVQGTTQYEYYKQYVDKAYEILSNAKKSKGISDNSFLGREIDSNTKTALEDNFNKFVQSGPKLPLGTGPFKVNKVNTQYIIMGRNPYYWNTKNIKYDYIYLNYDSLVDEAPQYALKVVDRLDVLQPNDLVNNALRADKNIVLYRTYSNTATGLIFDIQKPPFNDVIFRRAIAYILDRNKIRDIGDFYAITDNYSTLGIPYTYAKDLVSPEVMSKMTKYNYDTKKAAELLQSIGWHKGSDGFWKDKNGKAYKFTIITINLIDGSMAEKNFNSFGFKTSLNNMQEQDTNYFYSYVKDKNIDMASGGILENALGIYDPVNMLKQFYEGYPSDAGHFPKINGIINMELPGYDGKTVDIAKTLNEMPYMNDDDMKKAISDLVWIANENAFGVTYYQNVTGFWINTKTVKGYPCTDLVKRYNRNVPVQLDSNGKLINEYQLFWQSQARLLVNGAIGPK